MDRAVGELAARDLWDRNLIPALADAGPSNWPEWSSATSLQSDCWPIRSDAYLRTLAEANTIHKPFIRLQGYRQTNNHVL